MTDPTGDEMILNRSKFTATAAATALVLAALLAVPAGASHAPGGGLKQTISAALSTPGIALQLVEICQDDGSGEQCEYVPVNQAAQEVAVVLDYTLASAAHLPSVDSAAGTPTVCEVIGSDGNVTKRLGAAITATGAFKGGSSATLVVTDISGNETSFSFPPSSDGDGTEVTRGWRICVL